MASSLRPARVAHIWGRRGRARCARLAGISGDADERTRTSTGFPPHGPEPCASTNSATSAQTAQCSRTISDLKRGLLILAAALALAPSAHAASGNVEVVVTLKAPPLAQAFIEHHTLAYSSFVRPHRLLLPAPATRAYLGRLASTQRVVAGRVRAAIPYAATRWHYDVVLNGFAVVLPRSQVDRLAQVPGVARVWPSYTYSALLDR